MSFSPTANHAVTFLIRFNLKLTVQKILKCSLHVLLGEQIYLD